MIILPKIRKFQIRLVSVFFNLGCQEKSFDFQFFPTFSSVRNFILTSWILNNAISWNLCEKKAWSVSIHRFFQWRFSIAINQIWQPVGELSMRNSTILRATSNPLAMGISPHLTASTQPGIYVIFLYRVKRDLNILILMSCLTPLIFLMMTAKNGLQLTRNLRVFVHWKMTEVVIVFSAKNSFF